LNSWAGLDPDDPRNRDNDGNPPPPDGTYVVDNTAGTLAVRPNDSALFAANANQAFNGCIDPQGSWENSDFGLDLQSVITLELGAERIAKLDYFTNAASWFFSSNTGLGLNPASFDQPDWNTPARWCEQLAQVPGCPADPSPNLQGTPGFLNDTCP